MSPAVCMSRPREKIRGTSGQNTSENSLFEIIQKFFHRNDPIYYANPEFRIAPKFRNFKLTMSVLSFVPVCSIGK